MITFFWLGMGGMMEKSYDEHNEGWFGIERYLLTDYMSIIGRRYIDEYFSFLTTGLLLFLLFQVCMGTVSILLRSLGNSRWLAGYHDTRTSLTQNSPIHLLTRSSGMHMNRAFDTLVQLITCVISCCMQPPLFAEWTNDAKALGCSSSVFRLVWGIRRLGLQRHS